MDPHELAEISTTLRENAAALDQLRRILELHGETLHRIERKLDQHFAAVEPDPEGTARGV